MTITKRILKEIIAKSDTAGDDEDSVVYVDNGVDCLELRGFTLMHPANGSPNARRTLYESVSGVEDGEMPDDGSIILYLSR